MKEIAWRLLWFLVGIVLNVGKDFVAKAIDLAKKAESLKNDAGEPFTGSQKFTWVFNSLVAFGEEYNWEEKETSVINLVIELSVNYLKSLK